VSTAPESPPATPHEVADHGHEEPKGFWQTWVFSKDHKVIGVQFLISSLLWGLVGGWMAMMVRTQIAWPGEEASFLWQLVYGTDVMGDQQYNAAFTMHASIMIFLVIIPALAGGFGNFLIPLMIGARDMAFPTLNMLSYWVMWPAFGCFLASFMVEGGPAATGWTAYPPLSAVEGAGTPGMGQTLWVIGVILVGWSSIMGAVNYITTIVMMRAPGMGFFRMPLTVWSLFITAILQLLATPVLGSAMMLLLLERTAGTTVFMPDTVQHTVAVPQGSSGQPLLYQHLFWFYSHPAVYIMILPAMGMVSDVLTTFARKPLFGYRPMVYSICGIAGLGFIVWGHHMFMLGTMMIALPSAVKVFNWLGTLWGGRLDFKTPMLWACAFVSMFIIGGLSGIFMAATPVDVQIHDTYFIVGHIHYVLFTGSLFGIFAGLTYWFPKMFGRQMDDRLGRIHFWLTFVFGNGTFFLMHIVGAGGMQRRIGNWTNYQVEGYLTKWEFLNQFMTVSAWLLFLSQLPFLWNFFKSIFAGEKVGKNPWKANSLEWHAPSPPGHGNFGETIPTVHRGPYEFSSPEVGEDFLPQTRELRPAPSGGAAG